MPPGFDQGLTQQARHRAVVAKYIAQHGPGGGPDHQPQHGLETPIAAHQPLALQVGHAGAAALQDGRQLAQQLRPMPMCCFLLGDVQRHHRHGGPPPRQLAGLHPGQQPALAQTWGADGIAHLCPAAFAQSALQALEFVARARLDLVAPYRLQRARATARWLARPCDNRARIAVAGDCRRRVQCGQRCLAHARSACRSAVEPAARGIVGGHADAGGVHQRTDLQPGQVVLVLQAAVLDHRHHPQCRAARHRCRTRFGIRLTAKGTQPGPQMLRPAIGQGHAGAHFDGGRAQAQLGVRGVAVPGQQLAQIGRHITQQHR